MEIVEFEEKGVIKGMRKLFRLEKGLNFTQLKV